MNGRVLVLGALAAGACDPQVAIEISVTVSDATLANLADPNVSVRLEDQSATFNGIADQALDGTTAAQTVLFSETSITTDQCPDGPWIASLVGADGAALDPAVSGEVTGSCADAVSIVYIGAATL